MRALSDPGDRKFGMKHRCWDQNRRNESCRACSLRLPDNPRLCDKCQRWNTGKHTCRRTLGQQVQSSPRTVQEILRNSHCILCQAFAVPVLQKVLASQSRAERATLSIQDLGPLYLDRAAFSAEAPYMYAYDPDQTGRYISKCKFELLLDGDSPEENWKILIPLELRYHSALGGLRQVKPWWSLLIDVEDLRQVIDHCDADHSDDCHPESSPLPAGFRLIDTHELCIVEPNLQENVSYVALSYVWSATSGESSLELRKSTLSELRQPGAVRCEHLPKLIWDAMVLCRELNERFLWTDRLCIVQDAEHEKVDQIEAMGQIYSNARFTIVATADSARDRGLPGVRGRPRSTGWEEYKGQAETARCLGFNITGDIINSTWNTRGWTYQEEALSRRCVYISNHRCFFSCARADYQQGHGSRPREGLRDMPRPKARPMGFGDFKDAVEDYTARGLTFESDVMRAFTGYSNVVAAHFETRVMFGMPECYISRALNWESNGPSRRRESVGDIPSWSWAAWAGGVDFEPASGYIDHSVFGCLIVVYIFDPLVGLTETCEEDTWFCNEERPDGSFPYVVTPHNVEEESWWATSDPGSDWEGCPHNRTTMFLHGEIDDRILDLIMERPSSLTFNTTVATVSLHIEITVPGRGLKEDVTIWNAEGELVGVLSKSIHQPAPEWASTTEEYSVLVYGASLLDQSVRQRTYNTDWLASRLPTLWFDAPGCGARSFWILHIMFVSRDSNESALCERLGIGFVLMDLWASCKPRWETIILI